MTYVYKCDSCQHTAVVNHGAHENPIVACPQCDNIKRRAIQTVMVNWNGLPPHKTHNQSPLVKEWVDGIEYRRDAYNEKYGKNVTA